MYMYMYKYMALPRILFQRGPTEENRHYILELLFKSVRSGYRKSNLDNCLPLPGNQETLNVRLGYPACSREAQRYSHQRNVG